MSFFRTMALILAAWTGLTAGTLAQSAPLSEDEIKALTLKAADYIAAHGIEAAEKTFLQEGEYRFGEIYVNVIDFDGNWIIYPPMPENKGKNIVNFIDEDGKMLGEMILKAGKAGEGWVSYRWKNPATKTIQPKITFVKRVSGQDYIAYIGVYK